ncbi:(Fe-S)-binding protein [Tumebacillus sp. ITR2]|uniref:(Fe-S)-binding protein n=1 Tax=Tumebacillus amylolyticus TaxID=2801339 RepID=A0ABS1JC11_9BACL|nr:(Fe-S)-binding protein [Tumebacillus amylolyticus]MBL0387574.1 (Fe-S)-binding protein [Tumebacillus amylolyticus]
MKVSVWITCLSDAVYPRVGEAMAKVLHRYGVLLHFPEVQTCCGQPAFNSGYWEPARVAANTILEAFADSDFVVVPSGSCAGMVHHFYEKLFAGDDQLVAQARALKEKTYEFSQFLVHVLGVTDLGGVYPARVTYHPSCHATRLLGIDEEPLTLLKNVHHLDLVPLPFAEDCCGFGGTFAVKMSDISAAMVEEKTEHILETQAEVLVGLDMGCLMNIGGRLSYEGKRVRVLHLAELLCEAVGLADARGELTR